MIAKQSKQIFLFLTNKPSEPIINSFLRLQKATYFLGDSVLLFHNSGASVPDSLKEISYHEFGNDILTRLNYTPIFDDKLVPGSNHFPVLDYFQKNPNYDHYWVIEDDVTFSGDWFDFFAFFTKSFPDAGFLSCHIRRFEQEPSWFWWNTLKHSQEEIPLRSRLRSFNPIMRLSKDALLHLHTSLINKWQGHHEVLIPTLLRHAGFQIYDFGGRGEFVPKGCRNRFYTENRQNIGGGLHKGTFRFRPVIEGALTKADKLYHPVKL